MPVIYYSFLLQIQLLAEDQIRTYKSKPCDRLQIQHLSLLLQLPPATLFLPSILPLPFIPFLALKVTQPSGKWWKIRHPLPLIPFDSESDFSNDFNVGFKKVQFVNSADVV